MANIRFAPNRRSSLSSAAKHRRRRFADKGNVSTPLRIGMQQFQAPSSTALVAYLLHVRVMDNFDRRKLEREPPQEEHDEYPYALYPLTGEDVRSVCEKSQHSRSVALVLVTRLHRPARTTPRATQQLHSSLFPYSLNERTQARSLTIFCLRWSMAHVMPKRTLPNVPRWAWGSRARAGTSSLQNNGGSIAAKIRLRSLPQECMRIIPYS